MNAQHTGMTQTNNPVHRTATEEISSEVGINGLALLICGQNTGGLQELSPYQVRQKDSQADTEEQVRQELLTTLPPARVSPKHQQQIMQKIRAHNQKNYDSNNTIKYASYYHNDSSHKKI